MKFIAVIAFILLSTTVFATTPIFNDLRARQLMGSRGSADATDQAESQMICTISTFFSIDANEQVSGTMHIDGRGLASCKNAQGFTTEVPVFADLTVRAVGNWANAGELSFSANSSAFVIPREIGQIQDKYVLKPLSGNNSKTLLFEGSSHDLVIEEKLTTATDALQKIEITGMSLRFDESAPTLD